MTPEIIHLLDGGRALCGQPGVPRDWPANHRWAAEADADKVNCPECLKELSRKKMWAGAISGRCLNAPTAAATIVCAACQAVWFEPCNCGKQHFSRIEPYPVCLRCALYPKEVLEAKVFAARARGMDVVP